MGPFHFDQPSMTGEYWAGWYDAWGGEHARTDADATGKGSGLDAGSRVFGQSLYVSWRNQLWVYEWRQFCRWTTYLPLVTSYDYDAALDEAGRPTKKFYLFRDVIQRRTGITPPPLPAPLPIASVAEFPADGIDSAMEQLAGSR